MESSGENGDCGCDRRTLLRRAAAAGVVGWTAPVILSSGPAAAAVFTAKCAPGTISATRSFVQTQCNNAGTRVRISLGFSGPCPCGGTQQWCVQLNSPFSSFSTSPNVSYSNVFIPFNGTTTLTGRVALGCTDRNGDQQFAIYTWSVRAADNGGACATANSLTPVTFTGRTLVSSATCPPLTTAFAAPTVANESTAVPGVRPPG